MKYVDILKTHNDGMQTIIATCYKKEGVILCEGDDALVATLTQEGIINYGSGDKNRLTPQDGLSFLEQLEYNFHSGYLNATSIKERS